MQHGIPFLSPWLGLAAGIPTPEEVPEAKARKTFAVELIVIDSCLLLAEGVEGVVRVWSYEEHCTPGCRL